LQVIIILPLFFGKFRDVRKASVDCLAVTPTSFGDLLIRIRDVSHEVRMTVYAVLAKEVQMPMHTIAVNDRVHLLDQGLQDRHPDVRQACIDMLIKTWLPSCQYSAIQVGQLLHT